jgi:hypothetical protein
MSGTHYVLNIKLRCFTFGYMDLYVWVYTSVSADAQEGSYLLSLRCQMAGGGGKGICAQVQNLLEKTGYLTWRKSKESMSVSWAGRD